MTTIGSTTVDADAPMPREASFGQEAPLGCGEDYEEENFESCEAWFNSVTNELIGIADTLGAKIDALLGSAICPACTFMTDSIEAAGDALLAAKNAMVAACPPDRPVAQVAACNQARDSMLVVLGRAEGWSNAVSGCITANCPPGGLATIRKENGHEASFFTGTPSACSLV